MLDHQHLEIAFEQKDWKIENYFAHLDEEQTEKYH